MHFVTRSQLADFWEELRNSYWLVPGGMTLGAIGLAVAMSYLDLILPEATGKNAGWATALKAGAARTILATLAGSMATIVGVVFSITIVALQLASSQFGPHVLRSFRSDRGSQAALGTLLGSFAYSLLVIVVVRNNGGFVPYASTYAGILFGIVALGVLIFFINHVTSLMRAEAVIASLASEVARATEQVFPEQLGQGESVQSEPPPALPACVTCDVIANAGGYIRRIDEATLLRIACDNDLAIRLDVRPGDFIVSGARLMTAGPRERADQRAIAGLRRAVVLGVQRTPEQDVAFALQHLEEVAIRSLSPAINAPYTAIPAIDQIGGGLSRLAGRRMPSAYRRDRHGHLRVLVTRPLNLRELACGCIGPIAHAAAGNARVLAHLVETVLLVADRAPPGPDRRALRELAETLSDEGAATVRSASDRQILLAALRQAGESAARAGRIA